jgi:hypothetical protein
MGGGLNPPKRPQCDPNGRDHRHTLRRPLQLTHRGTASGIAVGSRLQDGWPGKGLGEPLKKDRSTGLLHTSRMQAGNFAWLTDGSETAGATSPAQSRLPWTWQPASVDHPTTRVQTAWKGQRFQPKLHRIFGPLIRPFAGGILRDRADASHDPHRRSDRRWQSTARGRGQKLWTRFGPGALRTTTTQCTTTNTNAQSARSTRRYDRRRADLGVKGSQVQILSARPIRLDQNTWLEPFSSHRRSIDPVGGAAEADRSDAVPDPASASAQALKSFDTSWARPAATPPVTGDPASRGRGRNRRRRSATDRGP